MGLPLLSLPDSGLYLEDAPDFDGVATPEDARELGREFRWDTGLDVGLDVGREDARETVLEGALDGTLEFCLEVLGVDNPDRFRLASSLALCSSTYAVGSKRFLGVVAVDGGRDVGRDAGLDTVLDAGLDDVREGGLDVLGEAPLEL